MSSAGSGTSTQPMIRAGTPAAVQPAGTGSSTTLPAAILAQAPI